MTKSIDRPEYIVLCRLLRDVRLEADLPQSALARKLGRYQTFVSDCELQRIRLDMLQLADWCAACSTDLVTFAQRLVKETGDPWKRKATTTSAAVSKRIKK